MPKNKAPSPPPVPLPLWAELYEAARDFQILAPWDWMPDTQLLGIENEHGLRLISVLGQMREIFGLASYVGGTGVDFLLRLMDGEFPPEDPEIQFLQDSVLVDFVPRRALRKPDHAVLKQIEFRATGRPRLFPEFYRHKAGFFPWFLDESEARRTLDDLRKTNQFAKLLLELPNFYVQSEPHEFPFFPAPEKVVRLNQFDWRVVERVPPAPDPPVDCDRLDLVEAVRLPMPVKAVWELTVFFQSMPIAGTPCPYWPKLALAVETARGTILGFHLGGPEDTFAEAAAKGLLQSIRVAAIRPAVIRLDSPDLIFSLAPLAARLGIKLKEVTSLPLANEARRSMQGYGGMM